MGRPRTIAADEDATTFSGFRLKASHRASIETWRERRRLASAGAALRDLVELGQTIVDQDSDDPEGRVVRLLRAAGLGPIGDQVARRQEQE